MKSKVIKGLYIGTFGLFSLLLILLMVSLLLRKSMMQPIETSVNRLLETISPSYLASTILFIGATFVGFLNALLLPPTSRNEVEKIILPIAFISFSFLIMPNIINYLLILHLYEISFSFLVRLYLFAAYFSFALLVVSGIFSLGINSSKMGRYILLVGVLALYVTNMMRLDVASFPQQSLKWTDSLMFISTLSVIAIVSILNYWAIYARESTQHNMLKAIRIMLILIGIMGFISFPESIVSLVSVGIYTVGVFFGLSRRRFNQL
ncbi:MAG: hypothetical protein EOM67_04900 [Spirochaetia bacterium]|nr:hypothetical protein [Spirochaetia bacterium]